MVPKYRELIFKESRCLGFKDLFAQGLQVVDKEFRSCIYCNGYKSDMSLRQDGFVQFRMLIFCPQIHDYSANHLAEGCSALYNPTSEVEKRLCSVVWGLHPQPKLLILLSEYQSTQHFSPI